SVVQKRILNIYNGCTLQKAPLFCRCY
ncbi:glutathione S-transferase, N-terminal domain protein, partial [Vibrio parahaemolyticus 10296]